MAIDKIGRWREFCLKPGQNYVITNLDAPPISHEMAERFGYLFLYGLRKGQEIFDLPEDQKIEAIENVEAEAFIQKMNDSEKSEFLGKHWERFESLMLGHEIHHVFGHAYEMGAYSKCLIDATEDFDAAMEFIHEDRKERWEQFDLDNDLAKMMEFAKIHLENISNGKIELG